MRLTKLKLAGFKSFVDPTAVTLPGQLVGVVGPNGCGKSNIMDAVRWVLGESKASELRGESMQDVIFNGTSERKPVSRASVELVFDNAMGRALGQWSQYAELSVKRLLTRNGQSDYFINNLKVRRKDITDLFLGTGLGPRAYAIIGQGMISRIIEARPDDLRVFLEEAAGVTRYKERRRETEGRLEDTRENLARVEDIRLELGSQMEKLEAQAEVARRYHAFNDQLVKKQQILWLLRKTEADNERRRVAQEVERATVDLEAQSAALRETEARLEEAREAHFGAGDALHQAQSDMYAANAEVARLEAEIRHRRESHRQLESRLVQLEGELTHWQQLAEKLTMDRQHWEDSQEAARLRVEQSEARLEQQMEIAPQVEETHAQAEEELNRLKARTAQGEQRLQVEMTNKSHAERSLQAIVQRREKLREEISALVEPDSEGLAEKEDELNFLREELAADQETLAALQAELPQIEMARREAQAGAQQLAKELAAAEARRAALEQMQARVQQNSTLPDWLKRHGLADAQPLWKNIRVDSGWEEAVEAVLREHLNAIEAADPAKLADWLRDRPSAKLTVLLPGGAEARSASDDRLIDHVHSDNAAIAAALADWLAGIFTAPTLDDALRRREQLSPGTAVVTPGGDLVSRSSVTFFAPDKAEHGLLERQREIGALSETLADGELRAMAAQQKIAELESLLEDKQVAVQ
ncbi:MAG: chromosome segregation protein SMC, partial [Betaproteobacteria bacterium]